MNDELKSEFERRHHAVREAMRKAQVDVLVVPTNDSFTYLSHVSAAAYGAYLLFPCEGSPVLIINSIAFWRDRERPFVISRYTGGELSRTIEASSVIDDIRGVEPPCLADEMAEWLRASGFGTARIGVVGRDFDFARGGGGLLNSFGLSSLNPAIAEGLRTGLPKASFLDATGLIAAVRARKSAFEVAALRDAAQLADRCKRAVRDALVRPGAAEADLFAAYWSTVMADGGSSSWWFMLTSHPSASPLIQDWRDAPTDRRIDNGDIVLAELMPAGRSGYVGHAEACFALGRPANLALYRAVDDVARESHAAAADHLRAGATLGEVMAAADVPLQRTGLCRGAPVAYALGLFGLEPPMIGMQPASKDDPVLHEDMTMCLISHVYDAASGVTVRTGSTQLITRTGSECLNSDVGFGLEFL